MLIPQEHRLARLLTPKVSGLHDLTCGSKMQPYEPQETCEEAIVLATRSLHDASNGLNEIAKGKSMLPEGSRHGPSIVTSGARSIALGV